VLTPQNNVSLSNLTTIRALNAGALKTRAWNTLRAAVTSTWAAAPFGPVTSIPGETPIRDGLAGQALQQMRRGSERC
jgi:hypothetical protein